MKTTVKNLKNEEVGEIELDEAVFGVPLRTDLLARMVNYQLAKRRSGNHKTKGVSEISGTTKKPHRQKGTGRARQGSTRAPQFAGGGIVHGPKPRNYDQRTPKKMKAAALRGALSDRARNGRIHVLDSLISADKPSTKAALAALATVSERSNYLVVLERTDTVTWLSLRNAPQVHIVAVDQLNTYDVLASDDVIFTQGAYDAFVSGAAKSGSAIEEAAK
jgi:large subunit ribosomal protein L4